jgi:hypothetical protein
MISLNSETLFKNTTTLIEIPGRGMGCKNDKSKSISISSSVETLPRVCFGHSTFEK